MVDDQKSVVWCEEIILPDDDTLVFTVNHHISVHVVCQSVDVRRILILCLAVYKESKSQ